jgi:hypothetical protein
MAETGSIIDNPTQYVSSFSRTAQAIETEQPTQTNPRDPISTADTTDSNNIYHPELASLTKEIDKRIMVILRGGGYLKGRVDSHIPSAAGGADITDNNSIYGLASLTEEIDKRIMILLHDGEHHKGRLGVRIPSAQRLYLLDFLVRLASCGVLISVIVVGWQMGSSTSGVLVDLDTCNLSCGTAIVGVSLGAVNIVFTCLGIGTISNHIAMTLLDCPSGFKVLGDALVTLVWGVVGATMVYGLAFYTFGVTIDGNFQYFTAMSWTQTAESQGLCFVDMANAKVTLGCIMSIVLLSCLSLWLDCRTYQSNNSPYVK